MFLKRTFETYCKTLFIEARYVSCLLNTAKFRS